ncbi:hypothetical protein [Pannonibacter phragmitetus]|uniref:hypothetical protein n=1 Tax=Pannonibacter phragmitetus TaxID=121719 RepID=UPI0013CF2A9B|nr:hypothetical protein [Pannonibacter phragmitetus]
MTLAQECLPLAGPRQPDAPDRAEFLLNPAVPEAFPAKTRPGTAYATCNSCMRALAVM